MYCCTCNIVGNWGTAPSKGTNINTVNKYKWLMQTRCIMLGNNVSGKRIGENECQTIDILAFVLFCGVRFVWILQSCVISFDSICRVHPVIFCCPSLLSEASHRKKRYIEHLWEMNIISMVVTIQCVHTEWLARVCRCTEWRDSAVDTPLCCEFFCLRFESHQWQYF